MRRWTIWQLSLRIVLALSLSSSAFCFQLSNLASLSARTPRRVSHEAKSSRCRSYSLTDATTWRLPALRFAVPPLSRPSINDARTLNPFLAITGSHVSGSDCGVPIKTTTALYAVGSTGGRMQHEDNIEGQKGESKGWRQRVVRTIVTNFLRIRALFSALGARLRLSGVSNQCEAAS